MFGFLLGVAVGAAGYWAYRFWKGDEDTSWEQSFSTGGTGSSSFGGQSSDPTGSGTVSSSTGPESSTTSNP